MEPVELFGFLWHVFPYTQRARDQQEPLQLPHWTDPPTFGAEPDGVLLLAEQGDWHRRFGRAGFLLLSEKPVPPAIPQGWLATDCDLPDGWVGDDEKSRVEVVSRGGVEDQSPVSGVRHYVRVSSRQI